MLAKLETHLAHLGRNGDTDGNPSFFEPSKLRTWPHGSFRFHYGLNRSTFHTVEMLGMPAA